MKEVGCSWCVVGRWRLLSLVLRKSSVIHVFQPVLPKHKGGHVSPALSYFRLELGQSCFMRSNDAPLAHTCQPEAAMRQACETSERNPTLPWGCSGDGGGLMQTWSAGNRAREGYARQSFKLVKHWLAKAQASASLATPAETNRCLRLATEVSCRYEGGA